MITQTRKAERRSQLHLMEALESRKLLSSTLSIPSTQSIMVFTSVPGQNSPTETLTITDTGSSTLNISAITIANDPNNATQDASLFSIVNASSIPASLAPGASFGLQLNYKATAVGRNAAKLDLQSDDAVNPLQVVDVRGIGVTSLSGGTNQPSLARILRAYEIPTIVGEGANDSNEASDTTYPEPPDASSQEVLLQRMVKAGAGPVTIQVLASFTATGVKPFTLGTYTPGNPNDRSELFFTPQSENQSTYVQPQGATTFDPGTAPFGFYWVSNIVKNPTTGTNQIGYTEDQFNYDTTGDLRKFRFFPMETPTGQVEPNAYIMTSTEWPNPGGYDFTNIVAIVRNIMPAPNVSTATPVIGTQPAVNIPGTNNLFFDRIQTQNVDVGDTFDDTAVLNVNNTGAAPLIISSYTLSSGFVLMNPPTFPLTILPGATQPLTIQLVATKEPSHPYNETQSPTIPNGGGLYSGTLVLNSNDPNTPATSTNLEGWWQSQSEHDTEPSVQTIMNLMAGWNTGVHSTPIPELTESSSIPSSPTYYGEETVSAYWSVADTSQQVSAMQLDSFHTQGNTATLWEFAQGSNSLKTLWTTASDYGQTFFPNNSSNKPAQLNFSPNATTFGFRVDGEWSDDSKNTQTGGGHHIRFFPIRTSGGVLVPNTYVMFMDYSIVPGQNFDFNDNAYIISNIRPAAQPAAPTDLAATPSAAGNVLQWAPAQGSIAGYKVYSSLAATSGFTLLTANPIAATTYTDAAAPAGTQLFYRVTSVLSSTSTESLGIESSTTTSGTPIVGLQSADIGATPAGSTTVVTDQSAYTIVAGGPGVSGNLDGFRYLFQPQTGNFDMRLQVSSITVAGNFSTAGIMARSTLDTDSPDIYAAASPVNFRYKARTTVAGTTAVVAGASDTFPNVWVRLQRVGNVFTAYSSADGATWTHIANTTAALPNTLFLGIAVASNLTTATTTASVNSYGPTFSGPIALADAFTATTGQPANLSVLSNDTDATGTLTPASVTISTPPSNGGTATVNSDGTITYTSAPGYLGTETFAYTVADNNSATSAPATVTITVQPPGPSANPDTFSAIAGSSVVVNVLNNDTDTTGTIVPSSVTITTGPNHGGTALVDPSTGLITYTPVANFSGAETFSYTVQDSQGLTSQPGLVTFNVSATSSGPLANPDSATSSAGQSVLITVLDNDIDATGTIDPTSVAIVASPNHGGVVQVDPATGDITYTPAANFSGIESFTYTVADNHSAVSDPATVTVNVTGASSGVFAADDSANTLVNAAVSIPVLANDTAAGTINAGSVTILSKPAHGTATANSDGTVTFTPDTGFLGADSFTYSVSDNAADVSNTATVTLNVGVELSSAANGNKSVTYTDASGITATITLKIGTADIYFSGSGAAGTPGKPGAVLVTGTGHIINNIILSGTTAASILTVKTTTKGKTIAIAGISDDAVLGKVVGAAELTGVLQVGGLSAFQFQSAAGAAIEVGGGIAAGFTLTADTIADTVINSSVPIRSIKLNSWSNVNASSAITAPSIGTISTTGAFSPSVTLTGNLTAAKIPGAVSGGWTIGGSTGPLAFGTVTGSAIFTVTGNVKMLSVHAGGFGADFSAANLTSLFVTGNLTGNLTLATAKTIKIAGNIIGATLTLTGALNQLSATGNISNTTVASAGNILAITASTLTGSSITAGVAAGATLTNAATATLGTSTISKIQLKSTAAAAFSNSTIIAHAINSASLGQIDTTNNGTPEGLAAAIFKSISLSVNSTPFKAAAAQLTSQATYNAYLTTRNLTPSTFGDFQINIV